jgi:hypothetical protein
MRTENTPQDDISTFRGNKKTVYITGQDNRYTTVTSTGWKVEEIVTNQAIAEFDRLAAEAKAGWQKGELSPLPYFMYRNRMYPATLAQVMRSFQWTLKRHFRPEVFRKLPEKTIRKYAEVFNIAINELRA